MATLTADRFTCHPEGPAFAAAAGGDAVFGVSNRLAIDCLIN
jgi:hypothetical protein